MSGLLPSWAVAQFERDPAVVKAYEEGVASLQAEDWETAIQRFDAAIELGSAEDGQRATFGASPGDGSIEEPYLYVGAWGDVDKSKPFWNSDSFNGAWLPYAELRSASDARTAGLEFMKSGYELLHA